MLLGKRPRQSMRRTTSMKEFSGEARVDGVVRSDELFKKTAIAADVGGGGGGGGGLEEWERRACMPEMVFPVRKDMPRRNSGDFAVVSTAHFLRACGLCKRRLAPGKDIFIYRGEIAFCSSECREQQINQDERKNKCSLASKKSESASMSINPAESSGSGGETVVAV